MEAHCTAPRILPQHNKLERLLARASRDLKVVSCWGCMPRCACASPGIASQQLLILQRMRMCGSHHSDSQQPGIAMRVLVQPGTVCTRPAPSDLAPDTAVALARPCTLHHACAAALVS